MKIIYANQPIVANKPSIFLAGPTPRDATLSWRPAALDFFKLADWDGIVYVPEDESGQWKNSYDEQVEWEEKALVAATCILFWIPRDLTTMPGFTTNVEWGWWYKSGKVVLGYPKEAPKMRYLDYHARKHNIPISYDLNETIDNAIKLTNLYGKIMKPLYIDPDCPECGEALTLLDILCDPNVDPKNIWLDEWACPKCYDEGSCYMDWPKEKIEELELMAKEVTDHPERSTSWEDFKKTMYPNLTEEEKEIKFKESEDRAKNITEEEINTLAKSVKKIINIKAK